MMVIVIVGANRLVRQNARCIRNGFFAQSRGQVVKESPRGVGEGLCL
jgi:hypothetical protein